MTKPSKRGDCAKCLEIEVDVCPCCGVCLDCCECDCPNLNIELAEVARLVTVTWGRAALRVEDSERHDWRT